AGSAGCGSVVMLPLESYEGVIQLGPAVSVIPVISLTGLAVRLCARFHVPSPLSSLWKPDQLPVGSRLQSCAKDLFVIAFFCALSVPRRMSVRRYNPS